MTWGKPERKQRFLLFESPGDYNTVTNIYSFNNYSIHGQPGAERIGLLKNASSLRFRRAVMYHRLTGIPTKNLEPK